MNEERADRPELDERTMRELAQLADGTLAGGRREALQARVASSPDLAAALERQRSAVAALRSLDAPAPAALRAGIEAESREPSPRPRRRLVLAGALAVFALLLAVLALPSSESEPSLTATAELAALPATQASVPVDPANPKLLAASSDSVPFPNLEGEFGWREAGARSDELDGRQAKTVFYERGGERIGYTILAGEPIAAPDGARQTTIDGVTFASTNAGDRQVVTWLREGHTCVLSGNAVSERELVELASWTGKGSVPF